MHVLGGAVEQLQEGRGLGGAPGMRRDAVSHRTDLVAAIRAGKGGDSLGLHCGAPCS